MDTQRFDWFNRAFGTRLSGLPRMRLQRHPRTDWGDSRVRENDGRRGGCVCLVVEMVFGTVSPHPRPLSLWGVGSVNWVQWGTGKRGAIRKRESFALGLRRWGRPRNTS